MTDKTPLEFFSPRREVTKGGRGRNAGTKPGAGTGGTCVCPECGHEVPHETGKMCTDIKCPECGAQMARGKTSDKPEGNTFVDRHPDPDWMYQLPGYQDEVAIHEELTKQQE